MDSDLWLQAIIGCARQVEETVFTGFLLDVWIPRVAFQASSEE